MRTRKLCVCLAVSASILFLSGPAWTAEGQEVLRATLVNGLRAVIVKTRWLPL